MADTLWMADRHDILIWSCERLLRRTSDARIFLAYMHHDDNDEVAMRFMEKAQKKFCIVNVTELEWRERSDDEEFDESEYGNVFVTEMAWRDDKMNSIEND